jgi:hypothetical protein
MFYYQQKLAYYKLTAETWLCDNLLIRLAENVILLYISNVE